MTMESKSSTSRTTFTSFMKVVPTTWLNLKTTFAFLLIVNIIILVCLKWETIVSIQTLIYYVKKPELTFVENNVTSEFLAEPLKGLPEEYLQILLNDDKNKSITAPFRVYTSRNIATVANLCIEDPQEDTYQRYAQLKNVHVKGWNSHSQISPCQLKYKQLVSYNSQRNATRMVQGFRIQFTTLPPPSGHSIIQNIPAYFTKKRPESLSNLYHFWANGAIALFNMLTVTNRLQSKGKNVLFYQEPVTACYSDHKRIFGDFLNKMSIAEDNWTNYTYHFLPSGTCFKNSVLSNYNAPTMRSTIADYMIAKYNIKYSKSFCGFPKLTLIQRASNRRILNTEEIYTEATQMGFNVSIEHMEDYSLREQLQITVCSDVLVGVQGAGLQWAMFMRPGRSLLEISWPSKGWRIAYKWRFQNYRRMNVDVLITDNVFVNYVSFIEHLKQRTGKLLTANEIGNIRMDNQGDWSPYVGPGRTADVAVSAFNFRRKLLHILPRDIDKLVPRTWRDKLIAIFADFLP